MNNKIDTFRGDYAFLSNFYPCNINYAGLSYSNVESAFQSMKTSDSEERKVFTLLNAPDAKRKGRTVKLRNDWESVKDQIMYEIVKAKFTQNKGLSEKLKNTGDTYLEEGNSWGDTYWGVSNGFGKNKLGKILMEVREELKGGYTNE